MISIRLDKCLCLAVSLVMPYLCEIRAREVGAQQFALNMFLNTLNDAVFMQKVHLVFCRMDVHIDVMRGNLKAMVYKKVN